MGSPSTCGALLTIDMISDFAFKAGVLPVAHAQHIADSIARLAARFHRAGTPVVHAWPLAETDRRQVSAQADADDAGSWEAA